MFLYSIQAVMSKLLFADIDQTQIWHLQSDDGVYEKRRRLSHEAAGV